MSLEPIRDANELVVDASRLTKHFRHPFFHWVTRARALTDLDLEIHRGEVVGLLGPNGSGKSTAIKLILGLLFPTSGSVRVFGHRPNSLAVKPRLGYLPEDSYLYRFLSARETLDFYGRLFGLARSERRRRTAALMELVGLQHTSDRPVGEFSKGMQRRVSLAQALINDPEFVIFDEPTSGMDPIGTADIKDLIGELKSRGKTVLLCSHVLSEVEEVCDRVVILYGGRVQLSGTLDAVTRRESLTQLVAELPPETVTAVLETIRSRHGEALPVDVSAPRESLERVFLRVVEAAQDRSLETSGAERFSPRGLDLLIEPKAERAPAQDVAAGREELDS